MCNISKFKLCKGCHCQSCFHQYLDQKRNVKSGRNGKGIDTTGSNKYIAPTNHHTKGTNHSNWSENWFQDIAKFRKEHFWACHSDRSHL